jgi:hypothetical protein
MEKEKTSIHKGVHWCQHDNAWRAYISNNGHQYGLGNFKTEEEAHNAFQKERARIRDVSKVVDLPYEEWRQVYLSDGRYFISNKGRLKSIDYRSTGLEKLIIPTMNQFGYLTKIILRKTYFIHGFVAEYFLGKSSLCVNHKDGNKLNNCVENLEYVSNRVNVCHALIAKGNQLGAHQRKRDGMWVSEIKIDDRRIWLGAYHTAQEATNRYIRAVREYCSEEEANYISDLWFKIACQK